MKKYILSTLLITVILFLYGGLAQMLPWGIPSTQVITAQSGEQTEAFQAPQEKKMEPGSLTTEKFDEVMVGKISTLTTDKSFSWIISAPVSRYNAGTYFALELLTQLLVAICLNLLLFLTKQMQLSKRILFMLVAATAVVTSIIGQQLNWWAMPAIYGLGVGINLIISWTLAYYISARWIIKSEQ
ncbi:hypothetical protein [Cecembia rubra]|uniref:hypothetical protein n=1 Tax=Cecembia rubra TaxID=1485585 RepID=UPI0027147349|nr:hypothetical protein [Cecembia rubra]